MIKKNLAAMTVFVLLSCCLLSGCKPEVIIQKPDATAKIIIEKASDEPLAIIDESEELKAQRMHATEQKLEKMMPVCDALMRSLTVSGEEYDCNNPGLAWMTMYIAVNQGVGVRDEYVLDREQNVTVPGWSVVELMNAAFAGRDELIGFPKQHDTVKYNDKTGNFTFSYGEFSRMSCSIASFIMKATGGYIVNMMLIDDEAGEYESYTFEMIDNPSYEENGEYSYPMRIESVKKSS